jgi:hypothetical protein
VLYVKSYMPVAVCLHLYAGTWVPSSSLWVVKLAYMSNCYISVYMPSALFRMLYAECYGLYAKLHMLDWNMPNAMTIAMSFMTTEQVRYFVIYIYLLSGYDSTYCRYKKKLILYHQGFSLYLRFQVFQYVDISWHEQNFSMPAYFISWLAYFISWLAYFRSRPAYFISWPAYFISWPAYFISQVTGIPVC